MTREQFLQLSSALIGISVSSFRNPTTAPAKPGDLAPRNSPIDLASMYLAECDEQLGAPTLNNITDAFQGLLLEGPRSPAEAVEILLENGSWGPICRSIMKLWFLGAWYSPDNPGRPVRVLSSQAFKEGLIWKVMQAHPTGYSTMLFGHWKDQPPPLDNFITRT